MIGPPLRQEMSATGTVLFSVRTHFLSEPSAFFSIVFAAQETDPMVLTVTFCDGGASFFAADAVGSAKAADIKKARTVI